MKKKKRYNKPDVGQNNPNFDAFEEQETTHVNHEREHFEVQSKWYADDFWWVCPTKRIEINLKTFTNSEVIIWLWVQWRRQPNDIASVTV